MRGQEEVGREGEVIGGGYWKLLNKAVMGFEV